MKTSIFNMNFTLPPMVEMTQVEEYFPPKQTDPKWASLCWDWKRICY